MAGQERDSCTDPQAMQLDTVYGLQQIEIGRVGFMSGSFKCSQSQNALAVYLI